MPSWHIYLTANGLLSMPFHLTTDVNTLYQSRKITATQYVPVICQTKFCDLTYQKPYWHQLQ